VEVLLPPAEAGAEAPRVVEPGWQVALPLEAGEGRLLVLNPESLSEILGVEGARTYLEIGAAVGALAQQMFEGPVEQTEIERVFGGAREKLARLEERAGSEQARDTVGRLKERLEEVRKETLEQKPAA
jgi:hypothetical protein